MVNPLQQSEIVLAGRGFSPRSQGNYAPGEYRRLTNVEVTREGALRNRRAVRSVTRPYTWDDVPTSVTYNSYGTGTWDAAVGSANFTVAKPIRNPGIFLGHLNEWAVFTTGTNEGRVFATNRSGVIEMYATTWLMGAGSDALGCYVAGFHRYNNKNYWVNVHVAGNVSTNVQLNYKCLVTTFDPAVFPKGNSDDANSLNGAPGPTLFGIAFNGVADASSTPASMSANMQIVSTFMFKNRMWIANQNTLYASKVSDPLTWAVPNGYFLRFPDDQINCVVAVRDSIYILGDSSIWVLNYSEDPNLDATVTRLSEGIGADYGCVYEDVVYFARYDSLYSIENNRVNKVLDLNYNIPPGDDNYTLKAVSYLDYIILLWQKWIYTSVTGPPVPGGSGNLTAKFRSYPVTVPGKDKMITCAWLNMENAASHKFLFSDQQDIFATADKGALNMADIYLVPFEDSNNRQSLYFHSTGNTVSDPGYVRGYTYVIDWDVDDFVAGGNYYDTLCKANGNVEVWTPRLDIEIDSYAPDDAEFYIKRFRHVMLEMDTSQFPLRLQYSFGDWQQYTVPLDVSKNMPAFANGVRPPYPFRFPINQRGRSITFKLTADPVQMTYMESDSNPTRFQIERLILTWSPTVRAPVGVASGGIE